MKRAERKPYDLQRNIESRARTLMSKRKEISDKLSEAIAAEAAVPPDAPIRVRRRAQEAVARAREEALYFEKSNNGFSEQIRAIQSVPKGVDPTLVASAARAICEPNSNVVVYKEPTCQCGSMYMYVPEYALYQCSNVDCGSSMSYMGQDPVIETTRKTTHAPAHDESNVKPDGDIVYRDYVNQYCEGSPETPAAVKHSIITSTLLTKHYVGDVVRPTQISTLTRKLSSTRRPQRIHRELTGRPTPVFSIEVRDRLLARFNEFLRVYESTKQGSNRCKIPNFDTLTRAFLYLDGEYELSDMFDNHMTMGVIEKENELIKRCFEQLQKGNSAFDWNIEEPRSKRRKLNPSSELDPDPKTAQADAAACPAPPSKPTSA